MQPILELLAEKPAARRRLSGLCDAADRRAAGESSNDARGGRPHRRYGSEAAGGPDVIEVTKVVIDRHVVEHSAKPAQGNAQPVWAAESAELATTFDMRLQVKKDTRYAAST